MYGYLSSLRDLLRVCNGCLQGRVRIEMPERLDRCHRGRPGRSVCAVVPSPFITAIVSVISAFMHELWSGALRSPPPLLCEQ